MLQDRALRFLRPAMLAQLQQLPLQCHQPVDARLHVLDMLVDQRIHAFALVLRAVAQAQQAADLFQGHVQRAAVADEGQPLHVRLGIQPVVALAARRLWQEAFTLVVANGFHRAVGGPGQLSDQIGRAS
uniref:Secreted protein n=1 Tax=Steinernema glaseri TaxID=37863 RepID=A0A1I8AUV2_9BILA